MLDEKGNLSENVGRLGAFDNENRTNFVRVAKEQALAHSVIRRTVPASERLPFFSS